MRRAFTSCFCFFFSLTIFAQSPRKYVQQGKSDPVKLTYLQKGVIKLESRTAQSTINIREHLYGCLHQYDGSDPKSRPSKTDGITIRVLDQVVKGDKFFLVLQISTGSGCNVQGRCGAGEEIAVYWFQFNSNLKQEKFQDALIESCQQDVELEEGGEREKDGGDLKLAARGGKLVLKFSKYDYVEKAATHTSLSYDRAVAEQGFLLKSNKEKEQ